MKKIGIAVALLLSGCGTVQPFDRVQERRAGSHSITTPHQLNDDYQVTALIAVPDDMGYQSISIGLSPVCDVVAIVVNQSANMQSTCSAVGRLSFYYAGSSRRDVLNLLGHALHSMHIEFQIQSNMITVTGGQAGNERSATIGDDDNQYYPVIASPSDGTISSFITPVTMRPVKSSVNADEIKTIGQTLGVSVTLVEYSGQKFIVSNDPQVLDAILAYLNGFAETSLFVPVPDVHKVAMMNVASQNLQAVSTEGGMLLTGNSATIANTLSDIRKISPVTQDYTVNAVFLSFSKGKSDDFSLELSNRGASRAGSMGYLLGGSSFHALLDFARSQFAASVSVKPSLSVTAGSSASFQAGQSVPIRTTSRSDGETIQTTEFKEVGVNLAVSVIPVGSLVRLLIELEISNLESFTDDGPLINTQRISTTVEALPGDIIILGGLEDVTQSVRRSAGLMSSGRSGKTDRSLQIVLQLERATPSVSFK